MQNQLLTIPECNLGFVEYNPDQPSTIIFLHGALSKPLEASLAVPLLEDYHILVPALHTNVKHLDPKPTFSISDVCSQLALLLRHRAKNGQAHVYGHSMGSHIALNLALAHPTEVMTVIASGATLMSHWSWPLRATVPSLLYGQAILPYMALPRQQRIQVFKLTMRPASDTLAIDWMAQPKENGWTQCKEAGELLVKSLPATNSVNIKARTLVIAAGATPADSKSDAKWIVNEVKKAGGVAQGIIIRDGSHPWIIQLPELCARVIRAWINGEELPEGTLSLV